MSAKILTIDCETAPMTALTWGLFNQNIGINQIVRPGYTLSYAAKWLDKRKILFDARWKAKGEEGMVQSAWELLNEADIVIHYNGKSFDIKILNREFLQHGLPPPDPFHQIDLLQVIRRQFRFQSNKLDFVSTELGIGSKLEHRGMALWVAVMDGVKCDQKVMEKYNKKDVVLTENLYYEILPWIPSHPNLGMYVDEDTKKPLCDHCGSSHVVKNGSQIKGVSRYQRYRCQSCKAPLRGRYKLNAMNSNILKGGW